MAIHPGVNPRRCADAIQAVLSSNLVAKFDEIDTDYGDGITLRNIANYYKSRLGQYDAYPCLAIFPSGQQGNPSGGSGGFSMRDPRIEMVIYELSNEATSTLLPPELMEIRLERMAEGVEHLLDANRSLTVTGAIYAESIDIEPPNYLDFEFSPAAPNLIRRSVSLIVNIKVK